MRAAIRVGTRASPLARAQSGLVAAAMRRALPSVPVELVLIETSGDRDRSPGASPDFTSAIERALRRREVDVAVHSTKDLPARDPEDLRTVAYPRRADPGDCVVAGKWPLPRGARVGSSSLRRRAQLLRWRPDLKLREVRGNVDTRLDLVRAKRVDAVVLARAGLTRLGRAAEITAALPRLEFLPAPGQGALAVQVRRGDPRAHRIALLDHAPTRAAVSAERALAAELGASCNVPLGALALVRGERLELRAEVLSEDGRITIATVRRGPSHRPREVARAASRALLGAGARSLLDRYR